MVLTISFLKGIRFRKRMM